MFNYVRKFINVDNLWSVTCTISLIILIQLCKESQLLILKLKEEGYFTFQFRYVPYCTLYENN